MAVDIFRRAFTIYVRRRDGSEAVLFHLDRASSDVQVANVDRVLELADDFIDVARPADKFFDLSGG